MFPFLCGDHDGAGENIKAAGREVFWVSKVEALLELTSTERLSRKFMSWSLWRLAGEARGLL